MSAELQQLFLTRSSSSTGGRSAGRWATMLRILVLLLLATACLSVDRSNFKTCDQSAFCKRHRSFAQVDSVMCFRSSFSTLAAALPPIHHATRIHRQVRQRTRALWPTWPTPQYAQTECCLS